MGKGKVNQGKFTRPTSGEPFEIGTMLRGIGKKPKVVAKKKKC
jgi:hypothetical protein